MNPSDEIKSKLDIIDVLREYIPLKPAGVNFRANCPFHHEKTPSFVVSPEKQIWHCFGCGKGGDILSFVMEMENISFVDALRQLASKAGVVLKKQDPQLTSQRNRLLDIVELASKYYHEKLLRSPEAESARRYLADRGLSEETMEEWRIGYSLDSWDSLINFLLQRGFTENEIFLSGMSVKKEGASRFYDRFRGRIMFPINDVNGSAVAFSARVSPDKETDEKMGKPNYAKASMGKYINSPQTIVYDKSGILFGLDKAKQEIKKEDMIIVAEGQMDVITAHQNGYKNVVASSGTALTANQVGILKRYSRNLALAFDMDKAGEMAAERGIREAMQAEMNTKVIAIPSGKDPDECIKNNKKEWEEAVKSAKPIMEYYFEKVFFGLDLSNVENKRESARKLLPVIVKIGNKIEQDFWFKKLSERIDVREDTLRETMEKIRPKATVAKEEPSIRENSLASEGKQESLLREERISELLLALLLKFPSLLEYCLSRVQPDQIIGEGNSRLYNNLLIYYNKTQDNWTHEGGQTEPSQVSYGGFRSWLKQELGLESQDAVDAEEVENSDQLKLLDKLALLGDKDYYHYDIEQAKNEIIKIIVDLKKYYLFLKKKELEKMIIKAEQDGEEEYSERLMEEFKALTDEIGEIGN